MKKVDKYLLEKPEKYIKHLDRKRSFELIEYAPPDREIGRGNKIILKIINQEDKDIILYSYKDYE